MQAGEKLDTYVLLYWHMYYVLVNRHRKHNIVDTGQYIA